MHWCSLANFIVEAAGIQKTKLDLEALEDIDGVENPIDELFTEEKLEAIIETATENGTYLDPYPIADKKAGKRFKTGLLKVMTTLINKVRCRLEPPPAVPALSMLRCGSRPSMAAHAPFARGWAPGTARDPL